MSALRKNSLAELLASLPVEDRQEALKGFPEAALRGFLYDWRGFWARPEQLRPGTPGASLDRVDWRYWLLQAGRGFGKTRTGGETVREREREGCKIFHLVAPTANDARDVMIEGPGGLMACYPPNEKPVYQPSTSSIHWPKSGAYALVFSADEPDRLRGKQCEFAWCDEIGSWRYGVDAWDQMVLGLRLGDDPRAVVTSTPKPTDLFKQLVAHPKTVITRGSTYDNRLNLAAGFFSDIITKYEGTRLGRQELLAELLEDIPGALWTRAMIDAGRITSDKVPYPLDRVVIAIDPAVTASETSDETGIGAIGMKGNHLFVLEDASIRGTPAEWARAALRLFLKWDADRIVAEVNNGGDLVEANLRAVHPGVPYRAVRASRGKLVRAEPVAALYEQGRCHHVGSFPELEDQMCEWTPLSDQKSPDRLDWLVWGAYDLVIAPQETYLVQTGSAPRISPY